MLENSRLKLPEMYKNTGVEKSKQKINILLECEPPGVTK
jgi:hypothetical protein